MPTQDLRVGAWSVRATAGTAPAVEMTWTTLSGPFSLAGKTVSLWVGGTVDPDPTDLTGATQHPMTVAGNVSTGAITIPEGLSVPLRVTLDGDLVATGVLIPSTDGTDSADMTVAVNVDPISIAVTFTGSGSAGGGGGAVDSVNGLTGVVVLTATGIGSAATGDVAATNVQAAIAELAAEKATVASVAALSAVYQPLDSDLTAIAALATTAYGRAFLALADAPEGRAALGLGTAATTAATAYDPAGSAAAAQAASQPLDSDLTAIAALATTGYGRSLLAAADAAALRVLAGTVIGTDVQAFDADLAALAAAGNSGVLAATTASFLLADETKLDGIEAGATTDQTAAEILAALLTVDGTGSGLDADLLDGSSSAAFETPAGAQAKADAKVAQTITDAVTTSAPSQDAVFDALALKQPVDSDLTAIAALTTTAYGRALLVLADAPALRSTAGLVLGTDIYSKTAVDAGFQPLDTDLTAIAALATTGYGRSLLAAADAAALRALAGTVIGTDVQAYDADLADLAAIADAQGDIIVRGAAGWERLAKSATSTHVLTAGASQPAWAAPSGGGGGMATDALWDAAGDLALGTGADTAARLAKGAQGFGLVAGASTAAWERLSSVVAESHADVTVVNTTVDTAVASLTLPGGAVAVGDLVRFTVWGDYLNNSGAAVLYAFKVKIGATTALATGSVSAATATTRSKMHSIIDIMVESTTAQRVGAILNGTVASANDAPLLVVARSMVGYGTAAENLATDKVVELTVTMGTANALADFVCHAATLEVIKKR